MKKECRCKKIYNSEGVWVGYKIVEVMTISEFKKRYKMDPNPPPINHQNKYNKNIDNNQ